MMQATITRPQDGSNIHRFYANVTTTTKDDKGIFAYESSAVRWLYEWAQANNEKLDYITIVDHFNNPVDDIDMAGFTPLPPA